MTDVSASRAALMALVCFGLGQALYSSDGTLEPGAFRWLVTVSAAAVLSLGPSFRVRWLEPVLGLAVVCEFAQQFLRAPGISVAAPLWPFHVGVVVAGALVGLGVWRAWWARWALVGVFVVLAAWVLHASPNPEIDVVLFQREGASALLHGLNPYALRYRDIYAGTPGYESVVLYGPGLSVDGVLQFGFPYFPLSLLLTLPAHALIGDYRWAQLLAVAFAGGVAMLARPGRLSLLAGAMLLFTPRGFFVLEQGWTEPLVLGVLAATVLAADKKPSWVPWLFGLLLAVKQYTLFLVPLSVLLLPDDQRTLRGAVVFLLRAAAPALLVTVPFVLWSPGDFWFDVVKLQTLQPFRPDALSFAAKWNQLVGSPPVAWWAFVVAASASAVCAWRLPRGPGSFLVGVTVTYLLFFASSKQAFANYYFFVIGAAALAVAFTLTPRLPLRTRGS